VGIEDVIHHLKINNPLKFGNPRHLHKTIAQPPSEEIFKEKTVSSLVTPSPIESEEELKPIIEELKNNIPMRVTSLLRLPNWN
jgi:hypothetical protein